MTCGTIDPQPVENSMPKYLLEILDLDLNLFKIRYHLDIIYI